MQGMYQNRQPDVVKVALAQGFIFGLIMLVVYILYLLLDTVVHFPSRQLAEMNLPGLTMTYIIVGALTIIALLLFFFGGISAARKTGRASSGWIAGHWGGLLYGIIAFVVYIIALFAIIIPGLELPANFVPTFLQETIPSQLTYILLFEGFIAGNLGGFLGGLVGSAGSPNRSGEMYVNTINQPPAAYGTPNTPGTQDAPR